MIHILNTRYCLLDDVISIGPDRRVELDLGCGSGGFTVSLAQSKPDALIFGADVMLGRLRKVEKRGKRFGVNNLELLRVEARHLMSIIAPDCCFDRVHILCPDPWPKHKHKGNRLMSADFMMHLNRVLKPGGVLHFATDDPHYMESTKKNLEESGLFEYAPQSELDDVKDFRTEFEQSWLEIGRTVPHIALYPKKKL